MSVSSYGSETKSSGIVKIIKDLDEPLEGKDVLIVEDIIDSGRTLSYLIEILKKKKPGKHPSVHASGQTGTQSDRCKGRLCCFQHSG